MQQQRHSTLAILVHNFWAKDARGWAEGRAREKFTANLRRPCCKLPKGVLIELLGVARSRMSADFPVC